MRTGGIRMHCGDWLVTSDEGSGKEKCWKEEHDTIS